MKKYFLVFLALLVFSFSAQAFAADQEDFKPDMVNEQLMALVSPGAFDNLPDYWGGGNEYEFDEVDAEIDGNKIIMTITDIDQNLGNKVKAVIEEAENKYIKHIVLKIQSFGGSAIDSLDALIRLHYWSREEDNLLETRIEPHAFSAGFLLSVSGDFGHRYGTPLSLLMWHEGSLGAVRMYLTATTAYEMNGIFEALSSVLNGWIAERSNLTKEEVDLQVYRGAKWMTSTEAIKKGFIDEIVSFEPEPKEDNEEETAPVKE